MNDDPQRLMNLFNDALARRDKEERDAFLAAECGDDTDLRQQVEALLDSHENLGGFLLQPVALPGDESPGAVIGRYRLLDEIGEGTFGRVFRAGQTEPMHRLVAIKVIKAGMDTREVVARFEAERQALALMDHPHIAKVLDAGTTELGRPYFVMELVDGLPVTDFCDQQRLPTEARLALFTKICLAVQHAHQKGIIHRDLKPSNILVSMVDGEPEPKVIDFGVAKALGEKLSGQTLFTAVQQIIGTPAYMSPEQADPRDGDIDTRSDIYSLGILLYELLTGVPPFDTSRLHLAAMDEIRRAICETDLPKPSTRLRTLGGQLTEVAGFRQITPAALTRSLHGDLDWIVMKALEKERARRYQTVNALIEDIRHHLAHEPVDAGPPSRIYRTGKFIRRHRFGTIIVAAVLLAILSSLASLTVGLIQAEHERDRAVAAERRAATQERRAEANYLTAREAVDQTLTRLASDLSDQPHMAQIRRELLEDALRFNLNFLQQKGDDPELRHTLATTYLRVGQILEELGRFKESQVPFGRALAYFETLVHEFPAETGWFQGLERAHAGLAYAGLWLEQMDDCISHRRQALAIFEMLHGKFPDEPEYFISRVVAHVALGNVFAQFNRPHEAVEEIQRARRLYEDSRIRFQDTEEDPALQAHISHWLGRALQGQDRVEEAERELRNAHALRSQWLAEHPASAGRRSLLAHIKCYLGQLLMEQGTFAEAETLLQDAVAIREKLIGEFPDQAEFGRRASIEFSTLAQILWCLGRMQEAETALRRSIEISSKFVHQMPGEPHYRICLAARTYQLGKLLHANKRLDEAVQAFGEALAIREELASASPSSPQSKRHLGFILATCPALQFRDPPRAVQLARQAVELAPESSANWSFLGAAQFRAGDPAAAIAALQKSADLHGYSNAEDCLILAMAHWQIGDRDQAGRWYDQAMGWSKKHQPAYEPLTLLRAEAKTLLGKAQEK